MKKYIIILSIILTANNGFAQNTDSIYINQNAQTESGRQKHTDADSMFVTANKLYNEGKYEDAVDIYEAVLDAGKESSYLYYNLGNAYFKQNTLAAAILNYERAYRLNPSDEDINHNLAIARSQLTDKFDEVPEFFVITIFGKIKSLFAANTWGIIALLSFAVFLILVLLFLFAGKLFVRRLSFWIACLVLLLSVSCKLIENNLRKYSSAIVFVPVLTAKTSPDDSGKDMFLLHEGTKVLVRDNFNEWTKIQLPSGEQGWVVSEAITII
ncbi:MAG: tetratricopeptide repeat protein [Prevotellaceae bacterium]|jgi:tetratricopeptide (TPR) repeat protein|nr:tetratricopeptide repeat protein [Prevotellaceae bacterium]